MNRKASKKTEILPENRQQEKLEELSWCELKTKCLQVMTVYK